MKIKLLILAIMLVSKCLIAQVSMFDGGYSVSLKHIKGLSGIEANFLLSKEGSGFTVAYSHFFAKNLFSELGCLYEQGKVGYTDFSSYMIFAKPSYTLFNVKKIWYVNGFISGRVGFELLNQNESNQSNTNFSANFGCGLNTEVYLTHRFILIASFDQIIAGQSNLGTPYYNLTTGFKYIFNN